MSGNNKTAKFRIFHFSPSPRSSSPASPGSPVQIKVTSEEIMEAYARQEKTFQEVFLNKASPMMLKTPPRTRSPSHR